MNYQKYHYQFDSCLGQSMSHRRLKYPEELDLRLVPAMHELLYLQILKHQKIQCMLEGYTIGILCQAYPKIEIFAKDKINKQKKICKDLRAEIK